MIVAHPSPNWKKRMLIEVGETMLEEVGWRGKTMIRRIKEKLRAVKISE